MKRYGPLIVVPGALAVGDPGRHHLRLTPDAVLFRRGSENTGILAWSEIDRVVLDVPTTRFRLPGLVSTVVIGALTFLTLDSLDLDPADGSIAVTAAGETTTTPLSRHHVGGYWAPTVDGAHRLLRHLIAHPEQRALLARPESLLEVAAKLARSAAPGPSGF
ncbi:hypothetical protein DXT68_07755 [Microbacterium foliorum]|uniref:Uncharacterized protein n=1 Tax=Microbacterium foliorum TaxID=104336 RepID=A0A0F0KEU6_9MICO|nr:hypothetical protein [Microbacterium foliorum]AXL12043.1 hypothetical protein DXT68_07755 [Microbacterium foliorum]KJL17791.1 hypothetical protein RN50_02892 [Microbacterium foliorum]